MRKLALMALGALLLHGLASASNAGALQIRLSQESYVITDEVREPGDGNTGSTGFYDLMLHNFAMINESAGDIRLRSVYIETLAQGRVLERSYISAADIAGVSTQFHQYKKLNFPVALDALFAADAILPAGFEVSDSATVIHPKTALIATANYVLSHGMPDTVRVMAIGSAADGGRVEARAELPVRAVQSKNRYLFPVEKGAWYVTSYRGIGSHHRFTQCTEFALDIVKVDARGRWFKGHGRKWSDWFGYGQKVLAAADGVVIAAVNDSNLDPAVWRPRDGESAAAYDSRLSKRQLSHFLAPGADPAEVSGGNYIVIKHANGEYTHYAHLAFGSVRVHVGEKVKQGEWIARVGGTGEAPQVHLHFQVSDSGDPHHYEIHTFPVRFINAPRPKNSRQTAEEGYFVAVH